MKTWLFEYYNPYPSIRVQFTVDAETPEEAQRLANSALLGTQQTAFYETVDSRNRRRARGETVL